MHERDVETPMVQRRHDTVIIWQRLHFHYGDGLAPGKILTNLHSAAPGIIEVEQAPVTGR
jgi:hypothetical protein